MPRLKEDLALAATDCTKKLRDNIPPPIAEALHDLGYQRVVDDVCASLAAVREKDIERCDALSVSPLQRSCKLRVAVARSEPEICPPARVVEGRDPLCLAWATAKPLLCEGVGADQKPTCLAVLENDAALCSRAPSSALQQSCRAAVSRYRDLVESARANESSAAASSFSLRVTEPGKGARSYALDGKPAKRGVYLDPSACAYAVELVDRLRPLAARPARGKVRAQLKFTWDPKRPDDAVLNLASPQVELIIHVPEHGRVTNAGGASGTLTIEELEVARAGAVHGKLRGSLSTGARRIEVQGEFSTFVRDLHPLAPGCQHQAPSTH